MSIYKLTSCNHSWSKVIQGSSATTSNFYSHTFKKWSKLQPFWSQSRALSLEIYLLFILFFFGGGGVVRYLLLLHRDKKKSHTVTALPTSFVNLPPVSSPACVHLLHSNVCHLQCLQVYISITLQCEVCASSITSTSSCKIQDNFHHKHHLSIELHIWIEYSPASASRSLINLPVEILILYLTLLP